MTLEEWSAWWDAFRKWVNELQAELGDERDRLHIWADHMDYEHGIPPTIKREPR